jgi:glycosyltransferase involved in cell wall biosynthesis
LEQLALRVLISAYACEPDKGSEPGVGWNWVRQIARFHEVWVITRANNRGLIEKSLATKPLPNVHWIYFDLPRWARFWKKGERGLHPYYYLWQLGAYFVARRAHRKVNYDLVHHVTFVNYWMPSFLAMLPIPFVWGPVGGGESAPRSFWRFFSVRGKLYEIQRDAVRSLARLDPFVRLTARRAALAFATTRETERQLKILGCKSVSIFSEAGLTAEEINSLGCFSFRQKNPSRLLTVGRLLHWKGCELGVRAFAQFHSQFPGAQYWIIGDGPERQRLQELAVNLGVGTSICFWGNLPRSQVLEKLSECDVLVHPSLHDSGGWVCLEAMAAGRPVICLDRGGPALQVTEETGVKISAVSPEAAVRDLSIAMIHLAEALPLRFSLSQGGPKRVSAYFEWNQKGSFMARAYRTLKENKVGRLAGAPEEKLDLLANDSPEI